jgi:hypothetical protein
MKPDNFRFTHRTFSPFKYVALIATAGLCPLSGIWAAISTGEFTWAPTYRAEELVTSWNSPVQGMNEVPPAPDPEGAGPVAITLSETSIESAYFGIIDLNITGLSLGQSVLLEKFKIDNDQGMVNAASALVESHIITDGIAAMSGEIFNFNLVNDVSDRNGMIQSQLNLWEPNSTNVSGEYVFRVSSPLGSFAAQTERLTITDTVTAQKFSGVVSSGGQPIDGAIVALLDPLADARDFIVRISTDTNGFYTLYAPVEDGYDIVVIKPGLVAPFAVGTEEVLLKNDELVVDHTLLAGTRTISGTLRETGTTKVLPGFELFFFPVDAAGNAVTGDFSWGVTDGDGAYRMAVTPDRWRIAPSTFSMEEVDHRGTCRRDFRVRGSLRETAFSPVDRSSPVWSVRWIV